MIDDIMIDITPDAMQGYRNCLRPEFPYIDEATPEEVYELILDLIP